jgi:hypothetical protein
MTPPGWSNTTQITANASWHQCRDDFSTIGYGKGLAIFHLVQDPSAVVSELAMTDRLHVANVAHRTCKYLTRSGTHWRASWINGSSEFGLANASRLTA